MTTEPINHHYVSQCLLRNFTDTENNKIYLYDKTFDNYLTKQGTRRIFSESDLNTTLNDKNQISYKLEHDLDNYFEKEFKKHYNTIISSYKNNITDIKNSIMYIGRMGIIGELRNKHNKIKTDNAILDFYKIIGKNASPKSKEELDFFLSNLDVLKYKTSVDFVKFADDTFAKMGEWGFKVFYTTNDKYFILSDCTSTILKHRINEYFNPNALDIAEIRMPLDNHTFIYIFSKKLYNTSSNVIKIDDDMLFNINKLTVERAKQIVACGQLNFLKDTINKIKSYNK